LSIDIQGARRTSLAWPGDDPAPADRKVAAGLGRIHAELGSGLVRHKIGALRRSIASIAGRHKLGPKREALRICRVLDRELQPKGPHITKAVAHDAYRWRGIIVGTTPEPNDQADCKSKSTKKTDARLVQREVCARKSPHFLSLG